MDPEILHLQAPDDFEYPSSSDGERSNESDGQNPRSPAMSHTPEASDTDSSDRSPSPLPYDEEHPNMFVPWNMKSYPPEVIEAWTTVFNTILKGENRDITPCLSKLSTEVLDQPGENGYSLLNLAACRGSLNIIDQLIQGGATPNKTTANSRMTPLMTAVRNGHIECVKRLLEFGNVDDKNPDCNTALYYAAYRMMRRGYAVCEERKENTEQLGPKNDAILEMLLNKGADFNCKCEHGRTPLIVACMTNNSSAVRMFLERGGDPLALHSENPLMHPWTTLDWAATCHATECLKVILDMCASNKELVSRNTAMRLAIKGKHIDGVKCLVEAGFEADLGVKLPPDELAQFRQSAKACPMLSCICEIDLELVQYLLSKGASPLYRNTPFREPYDSCPLFVAFIKSGKVLRLLLDHCAEMEGVDTSLWQSVVFPVQSIEVWEKPLSRFKMILEAGIQLKLEMAPCDEMENGHLKAFKNIARMWWEFTGCVPQSRHLVEALGSLAEMPASLTALCRVAVRSCIGFPRLAKPEKSVRLLPVPPHLQDYLAHM